MHCLFSQTSFRLLILPNSKYSPLLSELGMRRKHSGFSVAAQVDEGYLVTLAGVEVTVMLKGCSHPSRITRGSRLCRREYVGCGQSSHFKSGTLIPHFPRISTMSTPIHASKSAPLRVGSKTSLLWTQFNLVANQVWLDAKAISLF
jgi:hypothetical protein